MFDTGMYVTLVTNISWFLMAGVFDSKKNHLFHSSLGAYQCLWKICKLSNLHQHLAPTTNTTSMYPLPSLPHALINRLLLKLLPLVSGLPTLCLEGGTLGACWTCFSRPQFCTELFCGVAFYSHQRLGCSAIVVLLPRLILIHHRLMRLSNGTCMKKKKKRARNDQSVLETLQRARQHKQ